MPASRHDYLELLGLTEWRLRDGGAPADDAADVAVQAVAPEPAPARSSTPQADAPAASATTEPGPTLETEPERRPQEQLQPQRFEQPEPAPRTPATDPAPAPVATEWEPLQAQVAACTACALHTGRTQEVFGVGVRTADLLLVGEGPGEQEDARGEPFVGAAGQLLDRMLAAIGHSRAETVYIANVVKCRPPGNRKPHADEAAACSGYLAAQIALIRPKLIVALGQVAATGLLGVDAPVGRMRRDEHVYAPGDIPVLVTYHPAYYLRQPLEKRKGWDDLKRIRARLAELA